MTPFDEVLPIILSAVKTLSQEFIAIPEARGRILFEDIIADIDIPGFDNSAMDGFALKAIDTTTASPESPISLPIVGEYQAGINPSVSVSAHTAVRIMTGAPVPDGADAVIPIEDTTSSDNYTVDIKKPVRKGDNIRRSGEDVTVGQTVLRKGAALYSAEIGLLASLNYSKIAVYKRPSVAIIATGNEIVAIGATLQTGQVRDCNSYTLMAEVAHYHGIPHYVGIVDDSRDELKNKLSQALQHDIVITTGGVSMGAYDYVPEVLEELGIEIKIRKVKMKPGKPLVFGTYDSKLVFGLPGNPVSTMIAFHHFIRPAILKSMGANKITNPIINATLDSEIKKKPGRAHFIRGFYFIDNGVVHVASTGPQGSGILRSMSEANCLIIVPEDISFVNKGDSVLIQLIQHREI